MFNNWPWKRKTETKSIYRKICVLQRKRKFCCLQIISGCDCAKFSLLNNRVKQQKKTTHKNNTKEEEIKFIHHKSNE